MVRGLTSSDIFKLKMASVFVIYGLAMIIGLLVGLFFALFFIGLRAILYPEVKDLRYYVRFDFLLLFALYSLVFGATFLLVYLNHKFSN